MFEEKVPKFWKIDVLSICPSLYITNGKDGIPFSLFMGNGIKDINYCVNIYRDRVA